MKVEMAKGDRLVITPETTLEEHALRAWWKQNKDILMGFESLVVELPYESTSADIG